MSLEYLDRMIALGMGRAVSVGAFSTGIVGGGAGTILDQNQPELAIAVPAGIVIRPIYADITVQPGLEVTDSDEAEILLAVDSLGLWTGDGTATNENPSNMNTHFDKGSSCRVGSAFTADMTTTPRNGQAAAAPVLDMELAGTTLTTNVLTAVGHNDRELRLLYEPAFPEWLEGPCTLLAYWGGTIASVGGFARLRWVEAPISVMESYAGV